MFKGIEHAAIASPDPKKLAQWYVDHLEFSLVHEYAGNFFVRAVDGTLLEIIPSEGSRSLQTLKTPGLRHLAIVPEDFDAARQRLLDAGVEFVTQPFQVGTNRLVFFLDGDGNYLHLIERQKPLP